VNRKPNCVALFVADAVIEQVGFIALDRYALAYKIEEELSARVGRPPGDNFAITDVEGLRIIPPVLSSFDTRLRFSIHPFKCVPFALYDSTLAELLAARLFVGAGIKASLVFGGISNDLHVIRILCGEPGGVLLADDDFSKGRQFINWERFENAVNAAGSGYWTIGINKLRKCG